MRVMTSTHSTETQDHNLPVLTVGEVSQAVKRAVEDSFPRVRIRGEISGFKRAASGHHYFSLKDESAVLDGVCWRGTAGKLGLRPEDGMEVIATGRITTYPGRSKYQVVVESMELAGEGALLKLLEERRKKLAAEGLFDADRKLDIPFLPDVIGVVTSPTGAVIRDILHRISDRFPRRVILWPVLVQGEGAAEQIAAAIEGFNAVGVGGPVPRPDVIIVARGGGSLEDLMAFNEEIVVRAAADSHIPLISAIGHETDTTLIDFAADLRAPTPTAAAEMAVPVRTELLAQVMDKGSRLAGSVGRMMNERRGQLDGLTRGLPNLRRVVEETTQRLDDWSERLRNSLKVGVDRRRAVLSELVAGLASPRPRMTHAHDRLGSRVRAMRMAMDAVTRDRAGRLDRLRALLDSFSYERVLERGFALVTDTGGQSVTSVKATSPGMGLSVRFSDGAAGVTVNDGDGQPEKKKRKARPPPDGRQGNLL